MSFSFNLVAQEITGCVNVPEIKKPRKKKGYVELTTVNMKTEVKIGVIRGGGKLRSRHMLRIKQDKELKSRIKYTGLEITSPQACDKLIKELKKLKKHIINGVNDDKKTTKKAAKQK